MEAKVEINKHFSYLLEESNADFFQKAACEEASRITDTALAHRDQDQVKLASVPSETPLEKFASRVDQDLEILKSAGDCGLNLGMVRRTDVYMDRLLDRDDLPDGLEELWDKIAAVAIETDIEAAREELYDMVDEEWYPQIDRDLAEIGTGLVKEAQLDKEALIGALVRAGKSFRAAKGLGAGARLRAGVGGPRQAFREARAGRHQVKTRKAHGRLEKAEARALRVKKTQAAKVQRAKKLPAGAVRESVLPGVKARAARKTERAAAKVRAKSEKFTAKREKMRGAQERAFAPPKAPAKGPPIRERPSKVKEPKKTKKPTGEEPAAVPGAVAGGAPTTTKGVGEAFKKWRTGGGGWKALSSEEQNRLLGSGLAVLVGGRMVLGQGLITGGGGIV